MAILRHCDTSALYSVAASRRQSADNTITSVVVVASTPHKGLADVGRTYGTQAPVS